MLTGTQHKTLAFIRDYIAKNGYSPSLAEIAMGLGIKSRGVVHRYVHALATSGHIELTPGKRRNIRLKGSPEQGEIPLLGQIAAGQPIEAIQDVDSINPAAKLGGKNHYALRVKGDSMVDAGILDGDIVVIRNQETAHNGDIVVALVGENEVTLKRFRRLGKTGQIELIPENASMKPMTYHQSEVTIQGILVGQFRVYN